MQSEEHTSKPILSLGELRTVEKVFDEYFSSTFEEENKGLVLGNADQCRKNDNGVKLFLSSSASCLSETPVEKPQIRKRRLYTGDSSSSDDEARFAEAAISGGVILSQSAALQDVISVKGLEDDSSEQTTQMKSKKKKHKKKKIEG